MEEREEEISSASTIQASKKLNAITQYINLANREQGLVDMIHCLEVMGNLWAAEWEQRKLGKLH